MKKRDLIYIAFALLVIGSCKKQGFLEQTVTNDLDEAAVFSDSTRTVAFLTAIYADLAFSSDPNRFGNGGLDAACDETKPRQTFDITTSVQFVSGTIAPGIIATDSWNTPYTNIRRVNKFLKNLPSTPMDLSRKKIYESEARFLRAWYYGELLKHYGGIPMVGDTIYSTEDHIPAVRNTYEECVNYILTECDTAQKYLPPRRYSGEYGRIDQGICQAFKARLLLDAASPLYNSSDNADPLLGYTDYSKERWRLAAEAAHAVMNITSPVSGKYSLEMNNNGTPGRGFFELFLKRYNNEYILPNMNRGVRDLESIWLPPSRGGTKGGYPFQETVDAFGMKNGLPITDPNSNYDASNPYANRDPRLAHSIIRDQTPFVNSQGIFQPINIYLNPDGTTPGEDALGRGTPTGYYVKKMLADIAANSIFDSQRIRPVIRFAEVLLNYAEAKNEYSGPVDSVYRAIIQIRERAGIDPGSDNLYGLKTNMTKEEMREVIRSERRVELAFEGFRFWDIRRWKIAPAVMAREMHGMEVRRTASGTSTFTEFPVVTNVFRDAMYFWPIPLLEIGRSPELIQNPGY